MDACQHYPFLITEESERMELTAYVRCRRCGIATKPVAIVSSATIAGRRAPWEAWAAMMEKESAARALRAETDAACPQPGPTAMLTMQAGCWVEFCKAMGRPATDSPEAARRLGLECAAALPILDTLRHHLNGNVTPSRLGDLFVAMRKATKAFTLNARLQMPPEPPPACGTGGTGLPYRAV